MKKFLVLLLAAMMAFTFVSCDDDVVVVEKVKVTLKDGVNDDSVTEIEKGSEFTFPEAPTKEGYTFDGWYIGTAKYKAGAKLTITADTTIEAKFVETIPEGKSVRIGLAYYANLKEAISKAKDGDTIRLLKDETDGQGIIVPANTFTVKGVTIDFNGFSYSVTKDLAGSTGTESQCFQLLGSTVDGKYTGENNTKVYMKNGTIKADHSSIALLIQNYSDLTLDNMILDGTTITRNDCICYNLSNNFGATTLKNGTKFKTKEGNVSFDVWHNFGTYQKVSVLIETSDVIIDGKVEYGTNNGDYDNFKKNSAVRIPSGYDLPLIDSSSESNKYTYEWDDDSENAGYEIAKISKK